MRLAKNPDTKAIITPANFTNKSFSNIAAIPAKKKKLKAQAARYLSKRSNFCDFILFTSIFAKFFDKFLKT